MSDSVQPHRQQPIRLPRPWDSPGKNTGVGCHFLLQCMKVKSNSEVTQSCPTLSDPMDLQPTRLLCPWDFPGKSTGVGCHCLLDCNIIYYENVLLFCCYWSCPYCKWRESFSGGIKYLRILFTLPTHLTLLLWLLLYHRTSFIYV